MRLHLNETETCMRLITPTLKSAGWDIDRQVRREVDFTAGQIMVRGSKVARGKYKRADYLLQWKANFPLAIVEGPPNVNATSLRSLSLPLPPLAAQLEIVVEADRLMKLCDDLETRLLAQESLASRLAETVSHSLTA